MAVDSTSLIGEHDPARERKSLDAGLPGPAQGSASALQSTTTPVAMTLSQTSLGITVTPPEVWKHIINDARHQGDRPAELELVVVQSILQWIRWFCD